MIDWSKYEHVLDSRTDFEKIIQSLEKAVVKDYIRNFAKNKQFLTAEEYEQNKVYINSVHNYMRKLRKEYARK